MKREHLSRAINNPSKSRMCSRAAGWPPLVYVLDIPLLTPTLFHLYKMKTFPGLETSTKLYSFVNPYKKIIFSDPLRQQYCKMTKNELSACFQPNTFNYVCQENILMYNYIPELDCESTLLCPSTERIPENCDTRIS